jgi:outer membrane immunogenic protein
MAAAAAGFLAAGPATAADLLIKPATIVAADPWQGFYFGFHVGHGWSPKKYVDNFPVFDGEVDADVQATGFLAGAQLGYNFRFSNILVGVEGDFSWSAMKNENFACYPFGDQVCTAKPQMFADIAGRLGYIAGPWLFYAKGGVAFVQDRYENLATCSGSQPTARGGVSAACGDKFFADHSGAGWLVGGGVEAFIAPNWSAKLEYNYMDFGGPSVTFKDGNNGFFTEEIHQQVHIVKLGLNYHFGAADPGTAAAPAFLNARASAGTGAAGDIGGYDNGTNTIAVFGGFDVAKESAATFLGALISPWGDLDTSGFRLFLLGEGGYYRYPTATERITGWTSAGALLGGWAFEGDTYSIDLLAGFNAINHTLSSLDLTNDAQGTAFGAMLRADMRLSPTPQWMFYAEGDYSTAFRTFDATAKVGYEIFRGTRVYFGPEAGIFGDLHSQQWRLGAHVSEIRFGGIQFDISAGYANDSENGPGAYGHLEMSRTF